MARSSRVRLAPDVDAALKKARAETEALRDVEDAERLRVLLKFGQGLAAWVGQFDVASPATLLAAGAVGLHGIDALLLHIEDTLLRLAPFEADNSGGANAARRADTEPSENLTHDEPETGGAPVSEWGDAKRQLSKTLNYFKYLREFVAGNLRQEPDLKYPYEDSPESVPWYWTWQPADDETEAAALAWYRKFPNHQLLQRTVADAQRTHDRIASLCRDEMLHLLEKMQREDTAEGFPQIRKLVDAMEPGPKKARAKAALKKFERLTLSLPGMVPEPAPSDPTPFGKPYQEFFATSLIERFVAAGQDYVKYCLPLLVKKRGSLQGMRKKVARWIATVAQYVFMASSNGLFRRFAEVVAAVDSLSRYLLEDVVALLDSPSANHRASDGELRSAVRQMNALIVEPKVLSRWQDALDKAGAKAGAAFYGKAIEAIVGSEGKQTRPWSRGDVMPALRQAGIVTAKDRRKKLDSVTDACYSMQQVGLAVQVPLEYLLSEAGTLPRRKTKKEDTRFAGDGLPWIANPLGAVLADADVKKVAGKKRRGRKGRAQQRGSVISISQRAAGKKPNKSGRKVAAKSAPKDRLPATKAAKRWPRA